MSDQESSLTYKIATEEWEFEKIHELNYRTFVEEIPQHEVSSEQRLVDKFHSENTYLIGLEGRSLVAMIALRGERPFSLDHKLPDLDSLLPTGRKLLEIRLLAIERKQRGMKGGRILSNLLNLIWKYGDEKGFDLGIISATTRQLRLYRHLGFAPFGPLVGSGEVRFQPMWITREKFEEALSKY